MCAHDRDHSTCPAASVFCVIADAADSFVCEDMSCESCNIVALHCGTCMVCGGCEGCDVLNPAACLCDWLRAPKLAASLDSLVSTRLNFADHVHPGVDVTLDNLEAVVSLGPLVIVPSPSWVDTFTLRADGVTFSTN